MQRVGGDEGTRCAHGEMLNGHLTMFNGLVGLAGPERPGSGLPRAGNPGDCRAWSARAQQVAAEPPCRGHAGTRSARAQRGAARQIGALLAVPFLAACAAQAQPPRAPIPPAASTCGVTVRFGSFATGIDAKAAARVEQLIASDPAVASVTRSRPGIEGEYALCATTASSTSAAELFERLRKALAAPVRAPVSLLGPGRAYSPPVEQPRPSG